MRQDSNGSELIKAFVILGDFVLLNLTLLAFFTFLPDHIPDFFVKAPRTTYLTANFAMAISQSFFRTILHHRSVNFERIFMRSMRLTFAQAFLMFMFIRIISIGGGLFRFMFIFGIVLFLVILLARYAERIILKRIRQMGRNTRNIVFVGNDPAILMLYQDIIGDSSTGYKVQGYYADKPIRNCPEGLRHLGSLQTLLQLVSEKASVQEDQQGDLRKQLIKAHELFCSLSHDYSAEIANIMRFCDKNIIHFYYVPRMQGNFRLSLKPELFGDMMLFTNRKEPLSRLSNRFVKRTFDIVVSTVVCLCLLPFIPVIALIIKLQSKGPVFFIQARTGLNGKTFMCYKFRSMHINPESDIAQATLDDPRKFAFGRFMRKTNLDEFPQFFNVLKGDMSIVGPRPHMLHHTEVYGDLIDKYMVRHFSKPGITGWAQVRGFRGETKELWQMEERIKNDIWYIENWTFWLDIKIILMTFTSLFIPDKNAY